VLRVPDVLYDDDALDVASMACEDLVCAVRYYGAAALDGLVEKLGADEAAGRLLVAADGRGNTAMHMCAANGDADCIRLLARLCPGLVSKANLEGNTPLHWACVSGTLDAVHVLHGELGAETAAENAFGRTPVCEAQHHGRVPILEYFISVLGRESSAEGDSVEMSDDQ
jgi:hypothetical protein